MNETAFLNAIAETPDDDLTRLAYADWLEENGEGDQLARAELIRVQCEAERLPEWDRRRTSLLRRARAILVEHGRVWLAPMSKKGVPRKTWSFRRGFVEHVRAHAYSFESIAEKLFQAAPLLRAVTIPEAANEIEDLLESPFVARLNEIDLSQMCACGGCPIDADQRLLFASPLIAGLRRLRLRGNRIDDETACALAESPYVANLRKLDLSQNRIGAAGIRALATSPNLTGLTDLDLSDHTLLPASVHALCEGRWPALSVLRLNDCRISSASAKALAASPLLASLKMLGLNGTSLTDAGASALAKSPHLESLEWLDLGTRTCYGEVTTKALKARFGKRVRLRTRPEHDSHSS